MKKHNSPQPEEIDHRRHRNMLIIVVVCVIIAIALAKPVYRAGKSFRVKQLAAKSKSSLEANQAEEAMLQARSAYQLKTDAPESIRAMARVLRQKGEHHSAAEFLKQLQTLNVMTSEDRFEYAESLFLSGQIEVARDQVEELKKSAEPKSLRLASRIVVADHNRAKGKQLVEEALKVDPSSIESKLLLGVLQANDPNKQTAAAGRAILFQLISSPDRQGLEALRNLATSSGVSAAETLQVIEGIRAHPLAEETDKLTALRLEISLQPQEMETLIDRATAHYRTADIPARRLFAVWLNSRREHERVLELLPLDEARGRQDLLLVHLDALAALNRWQAVKEILETEAPLEEFYRHLFLARALMELGDTARSNFHWSRAHSASDPSVEQTLYLANYAEKLGLMDHAERACRKLAANSRTARSAYETLLRYAQGRRDTAGIRQILLEMHERWPTDNAVSNDYAYYSLLLKLDIQKSLALARQLVEKSPNGLSHITTLALAYLRIDATASALKLYQGLNIPWDQVSHSHRAVFAAVLAANGMETEAKQMREKVNVSLLGSEERALLGQ